jgi:hypothetical protein
LRAPAREMAQFHAPGSGTKRCGIESLPLPSNWLPSGASDPELPLLSRPNRPRITLEHQSERHVIMKLTRSLIFGISLSVVPALVSTGCANRNNAGSTADPSGARGRTGGTGADAGTTGSGTSTSGTTGSGTTGTTGSGTTGSGRTGTSGSGTTGSGNTGSGTTGSGTTGTGRSGTSGSGTTGTGRTGTSGSGTTGSGNTGSGTTGSGTTTPNR